MLVHDMSAVATDAGFKTMMESFYPADADNNVYSICCEVSLQKQEA